MVINTIINNSMWLQIKRSLVGFCLDLSRFQADLSGSERIPSGSERIPSGSEWIPSGSERIWSVPTSSEWIRSDPVGHGKVLLEGSAIPIDVVTDHKNLEYFSTTKVLTRRQARWSEFLSQFNMVIRFRPGKLGTKPDSLTRRWDVYPKEGNSDYATVNPSNYRPMFTQEQISASLRASQLLDPVLRATVIMDQEQLNSDILSALPADPHFIAHKEEPQPHWSVTDDGFLRHDNLIYIPDSNDLRLRVLRNTHDHILSGHPGQSKTIALIRRHYTWPGLREFVKKYIKSCTTCMRAKPQRHKPEDFTLPHRFQVESTWNPWIPHVPHGLHMEFPLLAAQPNYCRFPHGFQMDSGWNPDFPHGVHGVHPTPPYLTYLLLGFIWTPPGFHLDSRHIHNK